MLEMTSKKRLGWDKLFLMLTVLHRCRSLQVSIEHKEQEVAKGGDVTLTCFFIPTKPDFNILVLTWEAFPDNPSDTMKPVATFFLNNAIDIAPAYEGRAFLEVDVPKQVSTLRLTKVTMQDSRSYQCSVMIPKDDEGTTVASTSLLVLVPPSQPLCRIQGQAEYWNDITLTCMSEEGSPHPTYEWTTYSVENIPRQFPPKTTQKDGTLSLFNISREMSGFFICTSLNRIGSASCNLTLAVMPASMNIGATAGIIGAVVAGILCLGLIICCCCRKKGKKDRHAEDSPSEMEFRDRDTSETGGQYQDDYKSNNEMKKRQNEEDISQRVMTAERHHLYGSETEKERREGQKSDTDSQCYQSLQHDHYRGSRDHLDDQHEQYGGGHDRVKEGNYYRGSRDKLDDQRDRYGGSRDRLDDQRDRYGGSRDRLDDQRDRYGGSRDRLDDQRDRYGGSRDRLDDQRDRYGGSRDRLDNRSYGVTSKRIQYSDDH